MQKSTSFSLALPKGGYTTGPPAPTRAGRGGLPSRPAALTAGGRSQPRAAAAGATRGDAGPRSGRIIAPERPPVQARPVRGEPPGRSAAARPRPAPRPGLARLPPLRAPAARWTPVPVGPLRLPRRSGPSAAYARLSQPSPELGPAPEQPSAEALNQGHVTARPSAITVTEAEARRRRGPIGYWEMGGRKPPRSETQAALGEGAGADPCGLPSLPAAALGLTARRGAQSPAPQPGRVAMGTWPLRGPPAPAGPGAKPGNRGRSPALGCAAPSAQRAAVAWGGARVPGVSSPPIAPGPREAPPRNTMKGERKGS
ncbi:transcription initiation factor TFIID subunit 4-like [Dermochelys coriacea]|uniref:transcription initiation factor TFIID subunit 4-like n=1 Tax=Dermochelys coriacea TaxID=27794 RepID=UPI001CA9FE69|nr:transcription initiation factor TFIID subunit 4-like [Dermochelys coriacea]